MFSQVFVCPQEGSLPDRDPPYGKGQAVRILLEYILGDNLLSTGEDHSIIFCSLSLLPANEVWGKVIFSQASVCPLKGDGVSVWEDLCPDRDHPPYGKERAYGTHLTGMHSCYELISQKKIIHNSYIWIEKLSTLDLLLTVPIFPPLLRIWSSW